MSLKQPLIFLLGVGLTATYFELTTSTPSSQPTLTIEASQAKAWVAPLIKKKNTQGSAKLSSNTVNTKLDTPGETTDKLDADQIRSVLSTLSLKELRQELNRRSESNYNIFRKRFSEPENREKANLDYISKSEQTITESTDWISSGSFTIKEETFTFNTYLTFYNGRKLSNSSSNLLDQIKSPDDLCWFYEIQMLEPHLVSLSGSSCGFWLDQSENYIVFADVSSSYKGFEELKYIATQPPTDYQTNSQLILLDKRNKWINGPQLQWRPITDEELRRFRGDFFKLQEQASK